GGEIELIGVGTARAVLLTSDAKHNGPGKQLTNEDARAGIMTRWLATDYQPEPSHATFHADRPGLLVLATDGLWRHLPTPEAMAKILTEEAYHDAQLAANQLTEHARDAGGEDDLTAVVTLIAPVTRPTPWFDNQSPGSVRGTSAAQQEIGANLA
ncbi:MAG TPA: hypothetical protein VFO16_08500, partial [Pseudonocardiaceae bacterium]|nr:hypothetical protein [Pseudonocardiaceae bacterium]